MKEYAKKFYKGKAWRECRLAYISAKLHKCERCGELGEIVHHKKYITPDNINDPEVTLNWGNLELVCRDCHNREHNSKYSVVEEGLKFDEEGNLVKL